MNHVAFIGLGANLGDAKAALLKALDDIKALPQARLLKASSLYRTAPVDAQGPDFINAVAQIETSLAPHELLKALQGLENAAGRERSYRNAPRTLDLDVLLCVDEQGLVLQLDEECDGLALTLPHPRLRERAFVLLPLLEIAPELVSGFVSADDMAKIDYQRIERLT